MPRKKKPKLDLTAEIKPRVANEFTTPLQKLQMFKLWLMGKTYSELSTLFNISASRLQHIAADDKWHDSRRAFYAKQHARAVDSMQKHISDIVEVLADDFKKMNRARMNSLKQLSKDERKHLLDMLDSYMKEARLESGKPTEISNETRRIEIALPPGVKHYGIIPNAPNTTYIETTPATDAKNSLTDIDPEDIK